MKTTGLQERVTREILLEAERTRWPTEADVRRELLFAALMWGVPGVLGLVAVAVLLVMA
jgi:hypothetical protein